MIPMRRIARRCARSAAAYTGPTARRRPVSGSAALNVRSASFLSNFGGASSHTEGETPHVRASADADGEERIISALVVNRPGTDSIECSKSLWLFSDAAVYVAHPQQARSRKSPTSSDTPTRTFPVSACAPPSCRNSRA
jgi:hypothetical protein